MRYVSLAVEQAYFSNISASLSLVQGLAPHGIGDRQEECIHRTVALGM